MEGSEDEEEVNYVQANDHQRDNQNDHQHDHQQQYSFEEQFKQLYELSSDPKRKEFLDDLFLFMTKRGTPVNRIPIMAKQVLDLFELYRLVVARGGLVEVINKKIWREITKGLNLPSSITSAAFTLRTQYMKYLYPYECDKEHLSTPEELQQAIDGNRREGRRSSYGHYSDMVGSPGAGGSGCSGNSLGGNNNGSTGNGGPSIGGLSTHNITPSLHTASPLSLVARHLNAVNNNSGASSGEEDNGSIHSLSLNPLLALASAQAEALNLEVKPNINGHPIGLNNSMSNNQNNNSSSSLNSLSFNLENDTSCVNVNGSNRKDNNNNNNMNNNNNKNHGRDRGESNKRIVNNLIFNGNRKDSPHDTSGVDSTGPHSSSSSSSTSTSASAPASASASASASHNNGIVRNFSDDERLLINAGMPAAAIKVDNHDGRGSLENSLLFSMEMNNIIYSGILYPRSYQS